MSIFSDMNKGKLDLARNAVKEIEIKEIPGKFYLVKRFIETQKEDRANTPLMHLSKQYLRDRDTLLQFDKIYILTCKAKKPLDLLSEMFNATAYKEIYQALNERCEEQGIIWGKGDFSYGRCTWHQTPLRLNERNVKDGYFLANTIGFDILDGKPIQLTSAQKKKLQQEKHSETTLTLMGGQIESLCKEKGLTYDKNTMSISWNAYNLNSYIVKYLNENIIKPLEAMGLKNIKLKTNLIDGRNHISGFGCIRLDKIAIDEKMLGGNDNGEKV